MSHEALYKFPSLTKNDKESDAIYDDAVIIEAIHAFKDVVIELIDRKYQLNEQEATHD